MEDPVAKLAGSHRGCGAVENPQESVLASRARIYKIKVMLGGCVDGDLFTDLPDGQTAQVIAGTTELAGKIVEDRTCCAQSRVHPGTAESIKGLDLEVVAQRVDSLVEKKCIPFVGKDVGESSQRLKLLVRDEKFGGGHSGELIFQLLLIGKLRESKFSG